MAKAKINTDAEFDLDDPLGLIGMYLMYFTINGDDGHARLDLPVERAVLERLATRFHRFIQGDSLEIAFGGRTGRARQRYKTIQRAWRITENLQEHRRRKYSFEKAVEQVAKKERTSIENVKKLYGITRPPWDTPKRKISRKE